MSPVLACGPMFNLPMLIVLLAFFFGPAILSAIGFVAWFGTKMRNQTPYSLRSLFVWLTVVAFNFGWLTHVFT